MSTRSRMRKVRRISLNNFKLQCDLQPYLQSQTQELSKFETSLLMMQLLKRHQKLMFANKQNQINTTLSQLQKSNQYLNKLKDVKKKQKILVSSFKVLQQLDINKKQAYQILQSENKQISDRIYALQCALERMSNQKRSQTLCQQYLNNLQQKIKKRKKVNVRLTKIVQQIQQSNQKDVQKLKIKIQEYLKDKNIPGMTLKSQQKQQKKEVQKQNRPQTSSIISKNRIEELLQIIISKFDDE